MSSSAKLRIYISFLVLSLIAVFAGTAKAQATADIVGTVTDTTGAVVAGAKVTATNTGTSVARSMQTGASGDYAFTGLALGTYTISIEQAGFKTYTATGITIATGDRARVDAALEVGTVSQTVEVTASATAQLQTDSSVVGAVVTNQAVQDLPVNGRNFIKLVQLAPGASEGPQSSLSGGNRPDDRRQTSTIVANGQNDASNNFMLDGMDNNERAIATIIVKPSVDALQEVKVDTNLYAANLGRVGGAVVEMTTKSGSNQFHGAAFEFLRNDMFDAKDYFNVPQAGNPLAGKKPEFRQNQYGGSLGGPIIKDKTFFFADYEGLRIVQGKTVQTTVPTNCELGRAACGPGAVTQLGNFGDLCVAGFTAGVCNTNTQQIYDPVSHAAIPNNLITTAIPGFIQDYAALYPGGTCALTASTTTCPFVSGFARTQYAHTGDFRVDQHVNDKDSLFGRYSINNTDSFYPGGFPAVTVAGAKVFAGGFVGGGGGNLFPGTNYARQQNATLGWTHIFQPNLLMDLHGSISRYVSISNAANAGTNVNNLFGGPFGANSGIKGSDGLGLLTLTGYSALGDQFALPTDYWDTNYQVAGGLTWTKGSHSFRFGGSLLRRNWSQFQALNKATFGFASTETNSTGANGGKGGNPLASMFFGRADSVNQNISLVAPEYRNWEVGEYAQDDWRVSHWLTLNLGARYDIFTPFTEKHNRISNFDPTDPTELLGAKVLMAGLNGVSPTNNLKTQYNMIQPRLGFAATLGHGMVLRGGFGLSYFPSNSASPANMKNQPFASLINFSGAGSPANTAFSATQNANTLPASPSVNPASTCLASTVTSGCTPPANSPVIKSIAGGTSANFRNGQIIMYNLTLEKQFGANDLSVGWVGEPGRHLNYVIGNIDIPLPPQMLGGCGVVPGTAPGEGAVTPGQNNGNPNPGGFTGPTGPGGQLCQPYQAALPGVGSLPLIQSTGISSFNALNVIFQRRFSHGLTVLANYTYEHALSNVGGTGGACGTCGQIPTNPRYDWGNSDYDVPHRVAVSVNYQIPFGKSYTGVAKQIIGGWQVNGIYSFATGVPFTVTEPFNQMGIKGVTDRPNMTGRRYVSHSPVIVGGVPVIPWFDPTTFTLQSFGTAGNEERNQFFGPSSKRIDFSIFKDFSITEKYKLQFRTEVFNLFNMPNFAPPGAGLNANNGFVANSFNTCTIDGVTSNNNPSCGGGTPFIGANNLGGGNTGGSTTTSSLYTPRDIQFALKLTF